MGEMIKYREEQDVSKIYKEAYLQGIEQVINKREKLALEKRDSFAANIFQNQGAFREEFKSMLGWPMTEKKKRGLPEVQLEKLEDETDYCIYRVTLRVLNEFKITGLLFRKKQGMKPLVIVQHGGDGTPELVADFYGDTYNYNYLIDRVLQQDVHVFAPQLLLWQCDSYQVHYNRREIDGRLKRVGSSITALEVYALTRVLDYFEKQDYVKNFGMIGLSYGGFYALFTSAIDTRIKSVLSCSYYNTRRDIAWSDWTWLCSAEKFCDAEIACLIYPRRLCLEVGVHDTLFNVTGARAEIKRLKGKCQAVGTDWLDYIEFEGEHEFCKDDSPIKRLVEDLWKRYI